MKKLIAIFSVVFLFGGVLGVTAVLATPYTDITIYDGRSLGSPGWWNMGTNPGEDQEVELYAAPGQQWIWKASS